MVQAESEIPAGVEDMNRFGLMLAQISARFVRLPADQVDGSIEEVQKFLCEKFNLDRSALWQTSTEEPDVLLVTHLYQNAVGLLVPKPEDGGAQPDGDWLLQPMEAPPPYARVSADTFFPWVFRRLHRGETVIVSNTEDLPDEAARDQASFRRAATKSTVIVPLSMSGTLLGCVSFASTREYRAWPEDLVKQFQFVADLFTNALARKRADQELRRSEERYRRLFEVESDAILLVDFETGRIFDANAAAEKMYGYDREELLLLELNAISADPEKNLRSIAADESSVPLRWHRRKNGGILPVEISGSEFDDRGRRMYVAAIRDITERTKTEADLRAALDEVQRLRDKLSEENVYLRQEVQSFRGHQGIIGQSRSLRHVLAQVSQVAATNATVLLLGETGVGKEMIASAIHDLSPRRDRTMVRVNCAAIPSTLIESELFGREKGAYTGAYARQAGSFELASGSTLLLDEVGELPIEIQAKLLRVLQDRKIQRLGSPRTVDVDVRIIAASNQDLGKRVREGRFREDLYYRLNVFPINVPPLRERREDISVLVSAFIQEFAKAMGKQIQSCAKLDLEALERYPWPGNVRELRNVIERAVILAHGSRLKVELPSPSVSATSSSLAMRDAEREHIGRVLEMTGWRIRGRGGAAEILDVKPSTLRSRMAKLDLQRP
jgi:formate hydrogenlyase transcriptional activator